MLQRLHRRAVQVNRDIHALQKVAVRVRPLDHHHACRGEIYRFIPNRGFLASHPLERNVSFTALEARDDVVDLVKVNFLRRAQIAAQRLRAGLLIRLHPRQLPRRFRFRVRIRLPEFAQNDGFFVAVFAAGQHPAQAAHAEQTQPLRVVGRRNSTGIVVAAHDVCADPRPVERVAQNGGHDRLSRSASAAYADDHAAARALLQPPLQRPLNG